MSLEENMESMSITTRITDSETRMWVRELGLAAASFRAEIDSQIEAALQNWSFERLTPVTRLILEQAVAEACHMDIPAPVAVKEAVKMAVEFEGPKTGSFVNGVLDRLLFRKPESS